MDDEADIADRDEAMLAELAELDLALAKHIQAAAVAAEDPEAINGLARSYQRVARSLRQTLALKAKLKRDRARDARDLPAPPVKRSEARIAARKDELRVAVRRVIWAEREGEDADYLDWLLEDRMEDQGHAADFGIEPLDEHVADLCAAFGLPLNTAAIWRDLPDPPPYTPPDDDDENEEDEEDEYEDDDPPPSLTHQSSA